MTAIEIKDAVFSYSGESGEKALKGVSLSVEEGEFVAVLGSNGSGKSTLAKLINGLLLPSSGSVRVLGMDTADDKKLFDIRRNAGMVFQNPDNQMVASIVEDDVAFGPENVGIPREEIGRRIDYALKAVGMEEHRRSTPARLSGGQKQRVAIAGVLALKPKIMIFDESTAMLDPKGRREVMDVVRALNREEGITVLCITHFMEEALLADRAVVLDGGLVVMDGAPREIFSRPAELAAFGLRLPRAAALAEELRARGMDIPAGVFTAEELTEAVCEFLQRV